MSLLKKGYNNTIDESYKSNEISTMSQGKLIVMLYEGAIRFLNIATDNMTPRKYEIVNKNILKAQDILTELMTSLNLDEGGKIANDLLALYIYMKTRLLEANVQKNSTIINEVVKHLQDLKTAWEEIQKKESKSPRPVSGSISISG